MSQQINLFNPIFLKQKKIFSAAAMAQALCVLLGGVLQMTVQAVALAKIGMLPHIGLGPSAVKAAWHHPGVRRPHAVLRHMIGRRLSLIRRCYSIQIQRRR